MMEVHRSLLPGMRHWCRTQDRRASISGDARNFLFPELELFPAQNLVGFYCLSCPEISIHVDLLKDNVSAAQQQPMCGILGC